MLVASLYCKKGLDGGVKNLTVPETGRLRQPAALMARTESSDVPVKERKSVKVPLLLIVGVLLDSQTYSGEPSAVNSMLFVVQVSRSIAGLVPPPEQ